MTIGYDDGDDFAAAFDVSNQVYHDLVPVLCSYLEEDRHRIRQAIIFGSAIPLVMFISWEAVALGLTGEQIDGDPIQVGRATCAVFVRWFEYVLVARALADPIVLQWRVRTSFQPLFHSSHFDIIHQLHNQ